MQHKWEVTATQDEESFFDDHIETIIASDEALPPREQSLGETAVRWDRVGSEAFIQAQGGSVDDRILARAMVAKQLESFGILEATQSLDTPSEPSHVYYHGTSDVLPIGEYIHPPQVTETLSERGRKKNLDQIFFTEDPKYAQIYAGRTVNQFGGKPVVYRVQPSGPVQTLNSAAGATVYAAPSARVLGIHTASMDRTAEWNDIMDKARRLIQDGKVRILRNGYNNVVGSVKGDHGEYQPEIFRQDPNSRAITMSDCGCGWGEFQNQPRTRQWKKFQDRPCSHILATYWMSLATPLDEDVHPAMGDQGASQPQGQPGAQPGAMPPGGPQGAPQGAPAPMGPQQGIPPVSQPGIPPQGGPSPADVLPQFQTEPPDIQPQNPSSVPGLRGPTPTNPINYPPGPGGTFSSWQSLREGNGFGDVVALEVAEANGQVWLTPSSAVNRDHHVGGVSEGDEQLWVEVGGTDIGNGLNDFAAKRIVQDLNSHDWRIAADDTLPEVPEQDPRLTAPLVNGQMVQLRYPDTGIQQGRSEAHGAGQQTQLPAGLVGEVLGTDPTTGMVSVLYVGKPWEQNKEFEPFGATGEHWRSYLVHRPDVKRPGPAYRRTR